MQHTILVTPISCKCQVLLPVFPTQSRAGPELAPGSSAAVHGLKSNPELNGQIVILLRFDDESGRWQVRVDDEAGDTRGGGVVGAVGVHTVGGGVVREHTAGGGGRASGGSSAVVGVHTAGGGGGSSTAQLRVKPGNLLAQTALEEPCERSEGSLFWSLGEGEACDAALLID